MDAKDIMKTIPLEVVNMLKEDRKTMTEGFIVKIQHNTRNALHIIKKQNKLKTLSDTIDLLICHASMEQLLSMEDFKNDIVIKIPKGSDGRTRPVIVKGRGYSSVTAVALKYKIDRRTAERRIRSLKEKWKEWNYADEDIDVKYDERRID